MKQLAAATLNSQLSPLSPACRRTQEFSSASWLEMRLRRGRRRLHARVRPGECAPRCKFVRLSTVSSQLLLASLLLRDPFDGHFACVLEAQFLLNVRAMGLSIWLRAERTAAPLVERANQLDRPDRHPLTSHLRHQLPFSCATHSMAKRTISLASLKPSFSLMCARWVSMVLTLR
jgi:hypothetical protein